MAQIVEASGTRAVSITPSDSADLTMTSGVNKTKGVYVGLTGDLKVTMADGSTVTFSSLSGGIVHPLSVKRIWSTGTTATGIIAVY